MVLPILGNPSMDPCWTLWIEVEAYWKVSLHGVDLDNPLDGFLEVDLDHAVVNGNLEDPHRLFSNEVHRDGEIHRTNGNKLEISMIAPIEIHMGRCGPALGLKPKICYPHDVPPSDGGGNG